MEKITIETFNPKLSTANIIFGHSSGHFTSKENRNLVATLLKQAGHKVKLTSQRNVQLHPEYVEDFVGTYETGFGNSDYTRMWSVLYTVELKPDVDYEETSAGQNELANDRRLSNFDSKFDG